MPRVEVEIVTPMHVAPQVACPHTRYALGGSRDTSTVARGGCGEYRKTSWVMMLELPSNRLESAAAQTPRARRSNATPSEVTHVSRCELEFPPAAASRIHHDAGGPHRESREPRLRQGLHGSHGDYSVRCRARVA